jgi:hypothetical protein
MMSSRLTASLHAPGLPAWHPDHERDTRQLSVKRVSVALGAVIIAFIALVRFATAPLGVSLLHADYPGHFSEYYFSLRELAGTSHAELAFLAGYRPLHVVNLKESELVLFSPYSYMDKRSPDAIVRHLSQPGTDAYLSPDLRSHLRSHPATKGGSRARRLPDT